MCAAEVQDHRIVELLLKNKADPMLKTRCGKTAYDLIPLSNRCDKKNKESIVTANLLNPERWIVDWCEFKGIKFEDIGGSLTLYWLDVHEIPIRCFPKNIIKISGRMDLSHTSITSLENLEKVGNDLILTNISSFSDLGQLERVNGRLNLLGTSNLYSLQPLNFMGCLVVEAEHLFKDSTIRGCPLTVSEALRLDVLPEMQFEKAIDPSGDILDDLSEDLRNVLTRENEVQK